jgi:hypothetical protein
MNEPLYHVTSAANRESIREFGLDWTRMGAARGIAGSTAPEIDGVFVCRDRFDADFFVRINNTGGPVDVWQIDGVEESELCQSDDGFAYLPSRIAPHRLTLRESDLPAPDETAEDPDSAHGGAPTITLDDGTVLTDEQARDYIERHAPGRTDAG